MLEDHLVELAPPSPTRVEFRSGARPFGARAMTEPTPQDVTGATREVSPAFTGSPTRPIKTLAELQAWVTAADVWIEGENARRSEAAEKWIAEQTEALIHKPFGVLGL